MAIYTQLKCDFKLKKDTPNDIIEVLKFLSGRKSIYKTEADIDKIFPSLGFNEEIFRNVINSDYSLAGDSDDESPKCNFTYIEDFDYVFCSFTLNENNEYHLTSCANLKDNNDNIDLFFKFIAPFIDIEKGKAFAQTLTELGFCSYYYFDEDNDIQEVPFQDYFDTEDYLGHLFVIVENGLTNDSISIVTRSIDEVLKNFGDKIEFTGWYDSPNSLRIYKKYKLIEDISEEAFDKDEFIQKYTSNNNI